MTSYGGKHLTERTFQPRAYSGNLLRESLQAAFSILKGPPNSFEVIYGAPQNQKLVRLCQPFS